MTSNSERALTPAEEAGAYRSPDYEGMIRQGSRHPYAGRDELTRWSQEVMANLGKWSTELQAAMTTALGVQAEAILTLEARVHELELQARNRDDYEAEMRDRG
jgi:hypothetical protein